MFELVYLHVIKALFTSQQSKNYLQVQHFLEKLTFSKQCLQLYNSTLLIIIFGYQGKRISNWFRIVSLDTLILKKQKFSKLQKIDQSYPIGAIKVTPKLQSYNIKHMNIILYSCLKEGGPYLKVRGIIPMKLQNFVIFSFQITIILFQYFIWLIQIRIYYQLILSLSINFIICQHKEILMVNIKACVCYYLSYIFYHDSKGQMEVE